METTKQVDTELKDINDLLAQGYVEEQEPEPEKPQQEEQPKRKRGRPRKEDTQPEPSQEIRDKIEVGELVSGSILIMFVDNLLPSLMAYVNNKVSKDKIKRAKLQMTQKQKDELEPLANEAVKHLMLQANPMTLLIVSLITIYGSNFMMLKTE